MTDEPEGRRGGDHSSEDKLRHRARLVAFWTFLVLASLLVLVDTFGRLLIDRDFHVSELIFGTLVGGILAALGIEGLSRLPGGKG